MRSRNFIFAALSCAALLGSGMPGFAQTATMTPSTANPGKPTNTLSMPATPGNSKMPATPGMAAPATASAPATAPATASSMVNINTASAADLDKLPQIGKARSAKIIAGRPYKSTDELLTKKVLSKGVFDKIKTMVTAS